MSRLLRFRVSMELLKQVMQMPKESSIVGVKEFPFGWGTDAWFLVESDLFPEVIEGAEIPEIRPLVTTFHHVCKEESPDATWSTTIWDWNLGSLE